jgi:hypothetical protein
MSLPEELPHRVSIKQTVSSNDEWGGNVDQDVVVETGRAAWVQPASDREIATFQRREMSITHKVYFRGDPGVQPGYVIVPTTGPFAGATLEVMSSAEATAGTGLLYRVMVQEIQPR